MRRALAGLLLVGLTACSSGVPADPVRVPDATTPAAEADADGRAPDGEPFVAEGGDVHRPDTEVPDATAPDGRRASDASTFDAATPEDAPIDALAEAAGADAGTDGACEAYGAPGDCVTTTACANLGEHSSVAGHCPGAADIECCIVTPNTANDPPTPAGYVLMQQSAVTADMTTWAVTILDDPTDYPMFSETTKTFGTLTVLALVEWHPPDFQNDCGAPRGHAVSARVTTDAGAPDASTWAAARRSPPPSRRARGGNGPRRRR